MANGTSHLLHQSLTSHWSMLSTWLQRVNPRAIFKPKDPAAVLAGLPVTHSDYITADWGPVVFNLPEKASRARYDLYVVVHGLMSFDLAAFRDNKRLVGHHYATRVAYFRLKSDRADHVYGAHYDFSLAEPGHPTFHSQVRDFTEEYWPIVEEQFRTPRTPESKVGGILQGVRIPTAHMDAFSAVIQLCADHLVHRSLGPDERRAFNSMLKMSSECQGAAHRFERLGSEAARHCYRAQHWYADLE